MRSISGGQTDEALSLSTYASEIALLDIIFFPSD